MVAISGRCPGHPFLSFLDPPLKGTSKTLFREEPNMSTVFTKNIGMIRSLCFKKPWATCKGIGSPMQVPQFLRNRESVISLCLYMPDLFYALQENR